MLLEPRTARAKVTRRRSPYQRRGVAKKAYPRVRRSSSILARTSFSFSSSAGAWNSMGISRYYLSPGQIVSDLTSDFHRHRPLEVRMLRKSLPLLVFSLLLLAPQVPSLAAV